MNHDRIEKGANIASVIVSGVMLALKITELIRGKDNQE